MEFIVKITKHIQSLSKKQIQRYFLVFLLGSGVCVLGMIYFVYSKSLVLVNEIKRLESLANKATKVLGEDQKMEDESLRIQGMLDKEKDFNIRSYFESFCQSQGLPIQGWSDTRTREINDKFDEIYLPASFKGQKTEKLVKILEEFYKKEIIYVKNLRIKQEPDKKISFEITIATKAMKRGVEIKEL
jgi:hypothetical protein